MYSDNFLQEIPKTDLHLHLDGSLRLGTLIEIAKESGLKLPSYTEDGMKENVFKDKYNNLAEYLKGFHYTVGVLQTKEALERVAYELAIDNINQGICYIEVRFAPQLHINDNLSFEEILHSVNDGFKRAEKEFNSNEKVVSGKLPPFHYGIIVCALRMFMKDFSPYYSSLFDIHKYSSDNYIFSIAALELAKASVKMIKEEKIPIVGFDLAGQENGYPAMNFQEAFQYCHYNFLNKTVHAGEAYGAESIFQALTYLHANRIGHGFYLFNKDKIEDPAIIDRERYIEDLVNFIANSRIPIEVCLTSNLQTNPDIKDIKNHTLKKMLEHNLSVTLCSDNNLVSNTFVTKEIRLAVDNFNIPPKKLKDMIIYGFKRNFFYGSYTEKRKYCRQVIDYYEKIEDKHNIPSDRKI